MNPHDLPEDVILKMFDCENEIVEILPQSDRVRPYALEEVSYILCAQGIQVDLTSLGDEWCNQEGRISKRLTKIVRDQTGHKLESEYENLYSNLMQYLSDNHIVNPPLYYDLTYNFDWEDGRFGKSSSCWWDGYISSRDTLSWYRGAALRTYSDENDTWGNGRVWIMPAYTGQPDFTPEKYGVLLFNAYGYCMKDFANILLARRSDLRAKPVQVNKSSLHMYINEGSLLQLVAPPEVTENVSKSTVLHLDMEEHPGKFYYSLHGTPSCNRCGTSLLNDDYELALHFFYNNRRYCPTCYESFFTPCDICNQRTDRARLTTPVDKPNVFYCPDCQAHRLTRCYGCSEYYTRRKSNPFHNYNDHNYCPVCYDRLFKPCPLCQETTHRDNFQSYYDSNDHLTLACNQCYSDLVNLHYCRHCGMMSVNSYTVHYNRNSYTDEISTHNYCPECIHDTTRVMICPTCQGYFLARAYGIHSQSCPPQPAPEPEPDQLTLDLDAWFYHETQPEPEPPF